MGFETVLTEEYDRDGGRQTLSFDEYDVDYKQFVRSVIPFTVGYVSVTYDQREHGVVDIDYTGKTITVAPIAES